MTRHFPKEDIRKAAGTQKRCESKSRTYHLMPANGSSSARQDLPNAVRMWTKGNTWALLAEVHAATTTREKRPHQPQLQAGRPPCRRATRRACGRPGNPSGQGPCVPTMVPTAVTDLSQEGACGPHRWHL